nr:hypothetical protein [uncultured Pseudogulbenkiania sp.]
MDSKHRLTGWLLLLALALALPLGGCHSMGDPGATPTHDSDMGDHGRGGGGY